jgi:hypothetical protein
MPDRTPGQLAYEKFCKYSGGKSLVTGAPLLTWEKQSEAMRAAWEAAAEAIIGTDFRRKEGRVPKRKKDDT